MTAFAPPAVHPARALAVAASATRKKLIASPVSVSLPTTATPAALAKAARIRATLDALYPDPPATFLPAANHFELLIKVLLSAQSTDIRVNKHAPDIFARFGSSPQELLDRATQPELEDVIRPIGLAPRKSRNILALSRLLVDKHNARVPDTLEELEQLPGVGHKTASVVLLHAFNKPAFPVDTHIHRLGCRWGVGHPKSVDKTEALFKQWFPEDHLWGRLHVQLILFGRQYCPARSHDMDQCPICEWAATDEAVAANKSSPQKFVPAAWHKQPESMRIVLEKKETAEIIRKLDFEYDTPPNSDVDGKASPSDIRNLAKRRKGHGADSVRKEALNQKDIQADTDVEIPLRRASPRLRKQRRTPAE